MADPVTMSTAIAMFAPEMIGMEAALAAAPEVAAGIGTAAGAAGAGAIAGGEIAPLAAGADPYLQMMATQAPNGLWETGALAQQDKMGALLQKMGPKAALQMAGQMGGGQQPMPQGAGPRMGGQQQQAQPVAVDYGGAMPRKSGGAAGMLNVSDEELQRLMMALRGY